MNDRFKFRAYNKIVKKFTYFDEPILHLSDESGLLFTLSDVNDNALYLSNYSEINQYIGRKDRNGKDIYENDIIKNRETGVYYQIIWNEEATAFMAKSKNNTISTYVLFSDYQYQIEVYGNIYTTPELLEGKE